MLSWGAMKTAYLRPVVVKVALLSMPSPSGGHDKHPEAKGTGSGEGGSSRRKKCGSSPR